MKKFKKIFVVLMLMLFSSTMTMAQVATVPAFQKRMSDQVKPYISTTHTKIEVFVAMYEAAKNPNTWAPGWSKKVTADVLKPFAKPMDFPVYTSDEEMVAAEMARTSMTQLFYNIIVKLRNEPECNVRLTPQEVQSFK